ncbi:SMDT1 [Branchiostoma lanceolatum]|uniref:Essential MCU regulator, mitochondrial n=1 Tax=Branchiostoma lanceolatum TaxID=7740 RepID=A0A8K0F378_BRALA|nr:SMDT1 [Branchiostoma lanceolatum]
MYRERAKYICLLIVSERSSLIPARVTIEIVGLASRHRQCIASFCRPRLKLLFQYLPPGGAAARSADAVEETSKMATLVANLARARVLLARNIAERGLHAARQAAPVRTKITSANGALLPEPYNIRFGLAKVLLVSTPFLYLGAWISKEGAEFLEENDIFVPDDDDDD